ncbi:Ger(x)C family spore germination protein [Paenibacillus wynnii]|uniref:Ger(x)C family spore germination protein n=1 Tax=Paenibacillus wynnii TaxID=268407 RepID=UPI0027924840|nr:Ger(x)C family spore germination protein [Paenibacillus wynnii]MDQ0195184.1 spore germination protein KC [Paenibacillus wynnii]
MTQVKRLLSAILSVLILLSISGCWNYTEVEEISIVAGVAIDKEQSSGKILLTAETIDTSGGGGGGDNQASSTISSLAGDTMFDIVRSMITMTGNKLFWSHAKIIIISEEVAKEGVLRVIDWYSRDTETRSDVHMFITKEKRARDILNLNKTKNTILSFELDEMMQHEKYVSTAPVSDIWDFFDKLESPGQHSIAPLVYINERDNRKTERISGCAIFEKDKMVGTLIGEETKYMLFVNNKIKGGILPVNDKKGKPAYSLEIFSNKTKIKPVWVNGKLKIQISTETKTGLDEVMTPNGFPDFEKKKEIEELAEQQMQNNMLAVIHKVQKKYKSDIFGFGANVHMNMPKKWNNMEKDWDKIFPELQVVVEPKVIIETSAKTTRSIKSGD